MKLTQNSTPHFTVAAVWFAEVQAARDTESVIMEVRHRAQLTGDFEFHFNNSSNRLREAFFSAVGACDFSYFAMVVNKSRLWSPRFQKAQWFYLEASRFLFENMKPHVDGAAVVLDKSGDRNFRKQLKAHLKRIANVGSQPKRVKSVTAEDSKRSGLVQLADMVAGAVSRHYSPKHQDPRWRQRISPREFDVRFWPNQ